MMFQIAHSQTSAGGESCEEFDIKVPGAESWFHGSLTVIMANLMLLIPICKGEIIQVLRFSVLKALVMIEDYKQVRSLAQTGREWSHLSTLQLLPFLLGLG